ncbi:MAG: Arm DNA-binding domain-containing protein [Trichloromonadaceae bacterium]
MPKRILPLSDLKISKAKPKLQDYKLSDGRGLYLLVRTTGGKLWRYDYRIGGKRKTLAMGNYPDIALSEARRRHQEARSLIAEGTDPNEAKKARRATEW